MSMRIVPGTVLLAIAYAATPFSAHAYIDPGTGSILLQGVLGGAATVLVFLRMYGAKARTRVLTLLGKGSTDQNNAAD